MAYSTAQLSWSEFPTAARYTVRYRVAGTATWTLRTGIVGNSFLLTDLSPASAYDWAVAAECALGEALSFSNSSRFITRCVTPYAGSYSVRVTPTQARLVWQNGGPDYIVRWRMRGNVDWTIVPTSTATLLLNGLTPNMTYDWQVRSACAEEADASYSIGSTFTTQCSLASLYGQTAKPLTATSFLLSWSTYDYPPVVDLNTYTVGWRVQGSTNWTTASGVTSPYTLTDLIDNTTYEWQIRADCQTTFYSPLTFQTRCTLPINQRAEQQTGSTARLVWGDALGGTTYDLQWRVAGSDAWNTVLGINGMAYTLTGLTENTDYEWQVRGNCGNGAAYQTTVAFRLSSKRQTAIYTLKAGNWTDAFTWSCSCVPTGADAVLLRHAVTIPASYTGFAKQIFYEGAGQLKLSAASVVKPMP